MIATNFAVGNPLNQSELKIGMAAFERGDYVLAYKKLKPLSIKGDSLAQNTLGRMYLQGLGVGQNVPEALGLFNKAAANGLPNAQNNLGVIYAAGNGVEQNYKLAIYWFKKAADQHFTLAINNLADMYENGLGVYPDPDIAQKLRKRAQKLETIKDRDAVLIKTVGDKDYQRGLQSYYGIDGYAINFERAAQFFLRAAEQGNSEAQLRLAWMYRYGQGVDESEAMADYWLGQAEAGAHSLEDGRDRVLFIDASSSASISVKSADQAPPASLCACIKKQCAGVLLSEQKVNELMKTCPQPQQ
jgi:TPR repeat protein